MLLICEVCLTYKGSLKKLAMLAAALVSRTQAEAAVNRPLLFGSFTSIECCYCPGRSCKVNMPRELCQVKLVSGEDNVEVSGGAEDYGIHFESGARGRPLRCRSRGPSLGLFGFTAQTKRA